MFVIECDWLTSHAEYFTWVSSVGICCSLTFFFLDCTQISVSLCKDEPETTLLSLMRREGADKVRLALASYVDFLKTGQQHQSDSTLHHHHHRVGFNSSAFTAFTVWGCGLS